MKSAREIIRQQILRGCNADSIITALTAEGYGIVELEQRRYPYYVAPGFIVHTSSQAVRM